MNKIKDYIKNIDFELVDDDIVLNNVYKEIHGSEERLLVDIETSYNMEQLIKKSNIEQIMGMLTKVDIIKVINKKIGSRVFETVFSTLFILTHRRKIELKDIKNVEKTLVEPVYENLGEIIVNRNGTYVLRKYFEYIYGRNANEKTKHKRLFENIDIKSKLLAIINEDLNKEALITIVGLLKIDYSKRIAREIVAKYLNLENIRNPHYSFVFEDIIEIGDKKTLRGISKFIQANFGELVSDKCANYVVSKLISKLPEKTDVFYSLIDLQSLNINSNIMVRILENFSRGADVGKVGEVLKDFYHISEEDGVFFKLLIDSSEGLNTKFIDTVRFLMDIEGDVFNINSDFVKHYDGSWLNKKCGIKLVKSFLEGGATNKTKKMLISKLNISASLLKKKDGVKISNLAKSLKRTKG
ncbi:hypothetical protein NGRA_2607 [Nosema granulosis]|uniref:Uncharacterized protein n=1 Tax=Nosema granulosis TaxID=83296 RepID=A0A9P6GWA5_9MICR|nr:hypothetical protein NGRA_2607 [Nosema granulosis]